MNFIVKFFFTLCFLVGSLWASSSQVLYQGEIEISGEAFTGNLQMKFLLHNGSSALWSNDGTGDLVTEPTNSIQVSVDDGLYSVALGDTSRTNMQALNNAVLGQSDLLLKIWVDSGAGFQLMTPDKVFYAVPFAQSVVGGHVENTSANLTSLKVGSLTFPTVTGSANQVLTTDGLGNLTWEDQISQSANLNHSMIRLAVGNGFGSTNGAIRRFVNQVESTGSSIVYTDSVTDGASFTIQVDGIYHISYSDRFTTLGSIGFSLNSTELNTGLNAIANDDRLIITTTAEAGKIGSVTWVGILHAGDVIRAHTSGPGLVEYSNPNHVTFTITHIGTTTSANLISSSSSYDSLSETSGTLNATGNLVVSGSSNLGGLVFPTTTGSVNQVLATDGSGQLVWTDPVSTSSSSNSSGTNLLSSGWEDIRAEANSNYKPSNLGTAVGNFAIYYIRRVGDTLEVIFRMNFSSAGSGTSFVIFPFPGYAPANTLPNNSGTAMTYNIQHADPTTLGFVSTTIGQDITPTTGFKIIRAGGSDSIRGQDILSGGQIHGHFIYQVDGWSAQFEDVSSISSGNLNSSTGDITAQGNFIVTGSTNLGGLVFPNTTGLVNQVLTTDGVGNLSWSNSSGIDGLSSSNGVLTLTGNLISSPNSDHSNFSLGYSAMGNGDLSGYRNTALGTNTLKYISSGYSNTAIGYRSLEDVTTGHHNTAIGDLALTNTTSGNNNVAIGFSSLGLNKDGFNNTAVGVNALNYNQDGYNNIAVGRDALYSNQGGLQNVGLGVSALRNNVSGNLNIAIGSSAGYNLTSGDNNIVIGHAVELSQVNVSNELNIGNLLIGDMTSGSQALNIAGDFSVTGSTNFGGILMPSTTGSVNQILIASGNGSLGWSQLESQQEIIVEATAHNEESFTAHVTDIPFNVNEIKDTANAWNGSVFTAPEDGSYSVTGGIFINSSVDYLVFAVFDGATDTTRRQLGASGGSAVTGFAGVVNLSQGQQLSLRLSVSGTLNGGEDYMRHWIRIQKLANPQTSLVSGASVENLSSSDGDLVASGNLEVTGSTNLGGLVFPTTTGSANQVLLNDGTGNLVWGNLSSSSNSVYVYARGGGSQSIIANTTYVPFEEVDDPSNSWSGNAFTAPEDGVYLFTGRVRFNAAAYNWSLTSSIDGGSDRFLNTADNTYGCAFTTIYEMNEGQTFSVKSNVSATLTATNQRHWITIIKLDLPMTTTTSVEGISSTSNDLTFDRDVIFQGNILSNPYSADQSNLALGKDSFGDGALSSGYSNVAVGTNTMRSVTSGALNTGVGYQSMQNLTTGRFNVGLGHESLRLNATNYYNTAVGAGALRLLTSGNFNTGIGGQALKELVSGANNSAFGLNAFRDLSSGNSNVAIGYRAGIELISGDYNIFIGNDVQPSSNIISNELNIANLITGDLSNSLLKVQGDLVVTGSSNLGGLLFPTTDGTANQVLVTDGSGNLSFQDAAESFPSALGQNTDFESGTSGWVSGTDISVSLETGSNTLRGSQSLTITKGALNASGNSVTYPFTIARADLAKMLTITFDVDTSDTNYADGDLSLEIVADPGGTNTVISVNGDNIQGGIYTHVAQFQSDATETDYQLVIKVNSTNAAAYDVFVDNITISHKAQTQAAAITDWADFTPTGDWNTNVTYTGKYRRVGDSAEVWIYASLSGAPNSATFSVNHPDGLVADVTGREFGTAWLADSDTGANRTKGSVQLGATAVTVFSIGGSVVTDIFPFTFAAGDEVTLKYTMKVQGWSSGQTILASDSNQRTVMFEATLTGTQSIPDASETRIEYDNVVNDTASGWDASSFVYTIQESGWYVVTMFGEFDANASGARQFRLENNRVFSYDISTTANSLYMNGTIIRYFSKGAGVSVTAYQSSGGSLNIGGSNSSYNYLQIAKLSQPETTLDTDTVACSYRSDSGQTISGSSVSEVVIYEDKVFDTHNMYNTTTGVLTFPVSGVYSITATIRYNSFTFSPNEIQVLASSLGFNAVNVTEATISQQPTIVITELVQVNKGDTHTITTLQSDTISQSLVNDSSKNTFKVHRIR